MENWGEVKEHVPEKFVPTLQDFLNEEIELEGIPEGFASEHVRLTSALGKKIIANAMKKACKYHVEQALEAGYNNASLKQNAYYYEGLHWKSHRLVKSSIVGSYPAKNIK